MDLHFDLTNGVSGESLIAALLDLAPGGREAFRRELDKVSRRSEFEILLHNGYKKDVRCFAAVVLDKNRFGLAEGVSTQKMNYQEVMQIVLTGEISDGAKLAAVKTLELLARAEGRTGDEPLAETGDLKNVVEAVAVGILLDELRPECITASRVNLGSGLVISGGKPVQVPRPLVASLLEGVPVFSDECEGELTTPVGAALVKTIVKEFGVKAPEWTKRVGRGGGERDFASRSNVLTVSEYGGAPAPEPSEPAEKPVAAAETVDKIMAAMEDLEQNFLSREGEREPVKPAPAAEPEKSEEQPESGKQQVKLSQSILLEKLREIETKLQTAARPKTAIPETNNGSLEKFARLEDRVKRTAPREEPAREEPQKSAEQEPEQEKTSVTDSGVLELTASVASSTAEELQFLSELCLANGALDVFFEPIYANGFRPAYKLSVTVNEKDLGLFSRLILRHSSAMGVRYTRLNRVTMETETVEKQSALGTVRFTRSEERGDEANYEDKKRIALERGMTLREIERILDDAEDGDEE